MRSISITTYCKPSGYEIAEFPDPVVDDAKDVVIKVHAASINPVDVKKADGALKMARKDPFPYKIGYDCAGIVTAVGAEVTRCKVGDEVYTRLPESHRGAWSEYAACPEEYVSLKPASLSFVESASIPLAAMTALQALRKYEGDLAGKTVFVPAGCSYACQLAKHVFKAGKVITTVSSSKIPRVKELLGETTVDEIIDYTKDDPSKAIPQGSVDFLFDTIGQAMDYLHLIRPKTGWIISVSTTPSGKQLQEAGVMRVPNGPNVPMGVRVFLDALDSIRRWRAHFRSVNYSYLFLEPNGKDLDALSGYVAAGQLKPVVGSTVDFNDMEAVRNACQVVYSGRGGIGKSVIRMQGEN